LIRIKRLTLSCLGHCFKILIELLAGFNFLRKSLPIIEVKKSKMKNTIIRTLALIALLLVTTGLHAQEQTDMNKDELSRMDSLQAAYKKQQLQVENMQADEARLADVKQEQKQTKAKAKEARRVEKEANAAARESRSALRAEKKAQKARKDADSQSKRAAKARIKSDKN
jgi:hypothetical protein